MKRRKSKKNIYNIDIKQIIIMILSLIFLVGLSYIKNNVIYNEKMQTLSNTTINFSLEDIPEYTNEIFIRLNNNKPYFEKSEYTTVAFEDYSDLDEYGRCGTCYANICKEIMPKEGQVRESISKVKPTGWQQIKINGEYLYNRCHLIAYQLADESANEKNLITGTRYFNVQGMLPFENEVASYISKNENNHVLYRVTPVFKENNLLPSGVEIEAYSVEDNGKGVCFNVYIYNIQPGVQIDYETGKVIGEQ